METPISSKEAQPAFKQCSVCGHKWSDRNSFLEDPRLTMIGYQAQLDHLELGLFLFNHDCGQTLSLRAADFTDLYDGPVFEQSRKGMPDCPGYCLDRNQLAPCDTPCACAYVRSVIQTIRYWPKANTVAA
ncbi:MAG TPA: hypothetical protein PLP17_02990 [Oligoflexia bacterium]|nr:hypothetical protein [Oligoflexia bacterium]